MSLKRGALISAVVLLVFFSLVSFIVPKFSMAANQAQGPASVTGSLVQGQPQTVNVTFTAPSGASQTNYVLDTEIFSEAAGSKVTQFTETLPLAGSQSVTRSYTWQTNGLNAGKYIIKQGLFTPDWKSNLGWNDSSATVNLTSPVAAAPAATWTLNGRLVSANPSVNTALQIDGTFSAAVQGTYIFDLELYNTANVKVAQYYETRSVAAGAAQAITWNWPATATGSYNLKMGIFTPDWQAKTWNDNVLSLNVGGVAPATSQATPTAAPPVAAASTNSISGSSFMRGVNLSGAEFGANKLPGVYGIDYTYPSPTELDYYNSKGLKLIRLPFLWERVQPTLWGNLNQTELGRINTVIAAAKARNMQIILDPHNYDRYTLNGTPYLIGSSQVPVGAFKDFWTKLASYYKGETAVYAFGLMNEPHDTNNTWAGTAQAGLDGIRSVDSTHLVLVPGDGWSGAWSWKQFNSNLLLSDPANKLVYEAHQYFDRDNSGTYPESYDASGAYPTIGVDRVQPFVDWLKANHVRGIVTEYGVPNNDGRWQTVLDNFLAKLDAEGIGGTYWSAGPWWGNYALSAEPSGNQDKPVMSVLVRHLGK